MESLSGWEEAYRFGKFDLFCQQKNVKMRAQHNGDSEHYPRATARLIPKTNLAIMLSSEVHTLFVNK